MTSSSAILAIGLGMPELMIILLILLLLFGGSKLPSLAKGLGQSVKEFKKASREDDPEEKPATAATTAEAKKTEPTKPVTPGSN